MECSTCYQESIYFGLTSCGHKETCSTCWVKLRIFSSEDKCPMCRLHSEYIFIVSDRSLSYGSILSSQWGDQIQGFHYDPGSQLYFQDITEYQRIVSLNSAKCPQCQKKFSSISSLLAHTKDAHQKQMCHLCAKHSITFLQEQPLFTKDGIMAHLHSNHQKCQFCGTFTYNEKEMTLHFKRAHFFCEHCPVGHENVFGTQDDYTKHLKNSHFTCIFEECQQFVFPMFEVLKEHYIEAHGMNVPVHQLISFKNIDQAQVNRELEIEFNMKLVEEEIKDSQPRHFPELPEKPQNNRDIFGKAKKETPVSDVPLDPKTHKPLFGMVPVKKKRGKQAQSQQNDQEKKNLDRNYDFPSLPAKKEEPAKIQDSFPFEKFAIKQKQNKNRRRQ